MTAPEFRASGAALRTRARIAAYSIWDSLVRPQAGAAEPVPWHADAITPDWLTTFIGTEHAAVARSVDVTGGHNGSSVRRSLNVSWDPPGAPTPLPGCLFVKVTPTTLTRISSGMAARAEGFALTRIAPQLHIRAPWCLYSARDRVSGRSIHVFEDIARSAHVRFCGHTTTIDRTQADEMVDLLADLHGPFLSSGPPLALESMPLPLYETFFDIGKSGGTRVGHDQAITQLAGRLPKRLVDRRDEIWPAAERARDAHALHQRTVIHSDVHLGNWYITRDGHMGLADWACVCKGLWARDVAYALMTALSIDDRRNWERTLLERYLYRLAERFDVTVPWDNALQVYREQSLTALLMWTPTLCPAPGFPDMQPEAMSVEMILRIAAAMDDHDVLDHAR